MVRGASEDHVVGEGVVDPGLSVWFCQTKLLKLLPRDQIT